MGSETQLSPDRLNWVSLAADALELARQCRRVMNATRRSNWRVCFVVRPMRGDWCFRNGAGDQSKAESPK
jgi:hypothetical protein